MKKRFLVLSLIAAVAVPAAAEGMYIFGDAGQVKLSLDVGGGDFSKTDTTYALGVGFDVNKTFSFELAYRNLGAATLYSDEYVKSELEGSALQGSVIAKFPISPVVNVFGRLGISDITYDFEYQDFEYPEYDESDSDSKTKTFYGVGVSYSVDEKLSFRAEYNRYAEWEGLTSSVLAVGAVYKF